MPSARELKPADPGAALADAMNARLTRAAIAANGTGAVAALVFGFLAPVRVEPEERTSLIVANVAAFIVVLAVTLPLGIAFGRKVVGGPIERWLREERPAGAVERQLVLRLPARNVAIAAVMWGLAAIVFTAVNATVSPEVAATTAVVALLGGATSCAVGYLIIERIARPLVARALGGGPPPRTVVPGVSARLTMTWTLVTGIPLVGIAAMAIADLTRARIDEGTVTVATLFLAAAGLIVGLFATLMAARSVADPVKTVRDAMGRVEAGDFSARVPVDDGSEVGLLEAGFNSMASGLSERERLRDLFGRHVGRDVARAALENELRLGAEERFEYTVIGDPVNEAARLCELAKRRPGRLLASEAALSRAVGEEARSRTLGKSVELRGRGEPTRTAVPVRTDG